MENKVLRAHLFMLGANLIYGANYTIAKDVMPKYILPYGFILLRVSGAVVLFWILQMLVPSEKVERRDLLRLFVCAIFGVAVNQMMFFAGLNLSTPINAAVMITSNPILVLLLTAVIFKVRISLLKIIGIALGILGALYLILQGKEGAVNLLSAETSWGNILVLINSLSYAIYLIIVQPLLSKYHPVTIMKWVFTFGWFFVLPFGYSEFSAIEWATFPPIIVAETVFVVVGTTFVAYLLNTIAQRLAGAEVVSTYVYAQPVMAAILAILAGSDRLSWPLVISGVLVFSGVYLVSFRRSPTG
jgi:drug/metabolite transporter (DMT)-like permease